MNPEHRVTSSDRISPVKRTDYRFEPVFDFDEYCRVRQGEIRPRNRFAVDLHGGNNEQIVIGSLTPQIASVCKPASGSLPYPYIVPGGPYDTLWDWDAYFSGLAVKETRPECFRGSVLDLLHHVRSDGQPPSGCSPDGPSFGSLPLPLHAQWIVAAGDPDDSYDWVENWWNTLCAVRSWYEKTCGARRGLFRLSNWRGHGLDNDPVIHTRKPHTVAAVHVNCYHYREYRAMAFLAGRFGMSSEKDNFLAKAEGLRRAINMYLWDPIDGLHYHGDLSDLEKPQRQEITWELLYKVRSIACLWTLWAGVAEQDQVSRIVEEHVLNPQEYLSQYGIRSLAKNERIYNNMPMGGPSNWQGPVWGMSTFIASYGLAKYGYCREAQDVAGRTVALFAGDLRANGALHEYYNADTGEPVIKPGFLSWNLLGIRVLDDLRKGIDPAHIPDP